VMSRGTDGPEKSETKVEDKGEPEEAAAEIEAGGRRKEIADEAIRETACVEAERLTPPFHEEWNKKASESRLKSRGFFVLYGSCKTGAARRGSSCFSMRGKMHRGILYEKVFLKLYVLK